MPPPLLYFQSPHNKLLSMKNIAHLAALAAAIISMPLFTSCSACSSIEHSEEVTSEVTAAQMEGRRAAKELIHFQWKDSTQLRQRYREIQQMRDSIAPGHTAEFDSTFFSTLRIVEPTLAFSIQHGRL